MAYTTIDKPSDYFNTNLYTGNNTETSHTVGFQPDWTWLKVRNATGSNYLFDSVRGVTKYIRTNSTGAEGTDTNLLKSFDSNGYTIGTSNAVNTNTETMVGWSWKAGTAFTNDASATSVGSIDSSGSVNTDAGFSIVSFTASGSTGTVKHGLSTSPKMIIVKDTAATSNWYTYHNSIGNTKAIYLDLTNAESGASANFWNNTSPTTSVFSIGSAFSANAQIAYCFAEKQGYSKFGSYTGNGNASGPYIYTGHKPAAIIIKRTDTAKNWYINDNLREGYNNDNPYISPNLDVAETGGTEIDILSNGFRITASGTGHNQIGGTYMYASIAENPFVTSTGIPATAR